MESGLGLKPSNGQTIWIADAHRGDGRVRADKILSAFLEVGAAICTRQHRNSNVG
jgi:hypothetical protein